MSNASSLFEAGAAALLLSPGRNVGPADTVTPNAILRVEVQMPAVVHNVPLTTVERWMRSPNTSPRDIIAKRVAERSK